MQATADSVLPDLSPCESSPSESPFLQAKCVGSYKGSGLLASLVSESSERALVREARCGVINLRFCLSELCLTEFHNGRQAHLVPRLGKIERSVGLIQQLPSDCDSLEV